MPDKVSGEPDSICTFMTGAIDESECLGGVRGRERVADPGINARQ